MIYMLKIPSWIHYFVCCLNYLSVAVIRLWQRRLTEESTDLLLWFSRDKSPSPSLWAGIAPGAAAESQTDPRRSQRQRDKRTKGTSVPFSSRSRLGKASLGLQSVPQKELRFQFLGIWFFFFWKRLELPDPRPLCTPSVMFLRYIVSPLRNSSWSVSWWLCSILW